MRDPIARQAPKRSQSIPETGLTAGLISELVLKYIYMAIETSASQVCAELRLPFAGVVQPTLEMLDREELFSVIGAQGFGGHDLSWLLYPSVGSYHRGHNHLEHPLRTLAVQRTATP